MKLTNLAFMLPFAFSVAGCSTSPRVQPAIASDPVIERKVDSVLKRMTLEEKIGQMTQINIDVITKGGGLYSTEFPLRLDEAMLDTLITKYKVGSVLNAPGVTPLTPEEWAGMIGELQKKSIAVTGIPMVYGLDHIHGVTYVVGGTMLPQNINMGASFNPSLNYEGAKITAYESMAANVPWSFSPVLDLGRNPCWPRMWETYGEDSYLISVMGEACVKGYQGDDPNHLGRDHVAACLKHFMGYGVPNSGKDRTPASISDIDLRERHFAPFLEAIRAGALSVMVNSGINNGLPVHANYDLLSNWLKRDLGWDGMIVTDWADINNMCLRDRICETKKEAIAIAINAGIDMAMVPYEFSFCTDLKELVEEGTVKMDRIDDAVRRVLRMKFRMGLFERPYWSPSEYPDFGSEAHAAVARKAAEESITLLKNNDAVLPLRKNAKILLAGPNADAMRPLNGGWTLSWQGEKADLYGEKYNTIREALVDKAGAANVVYEPGVTWRVGNPPTTSINYWEENAPEIDKAVRAAAGVDYIVLCLGENSYCETPGNMNDLTLSANQLKLASALAATGKPVILVLTEGRPRIIASIEPQMKAVVQTYLPGNYGGEALANILYGDVNPSGKLPYTYPRYTNSLTTYDHKPCESIDKMEGAYNYDAVVSVQWAFGFGLSYTTFAYGNLKADKTEFKPGDVLTFTVDVTNTGKRAGKESVLLFSSDRVATVTPDVRRLRAFDKIELEPGQTKTVTLQVKADDLAFVGLDGKWRLEQGKFGIQVGDQTVEVGCLETKVWDTPNR